MMTILGMLHLGMLHLLLGGVIGVALTLILDRAIGTVAWLRKRRR